MSDPQAKLQEATVEHEVTTLAPDPKEGQFLGGRSNGQHFWNGSVKRLLVSSPAIGKDRWLIEEAKETGEEPTAKLDLDFAGPSAHVLEEAGFRLSSPEANQPASPRLEALTALCHAVLTSNEFLYLH
jgi:hypothetical protein